MSSAAGHILKLARGTYNKKQGKFLNNFSITFIIEDKQSCFPKSRIRWNKRCCVQCIVKLKDVFSKLCFCQTVMGLAAWGEAFAF